MLRPGLPRRQGHRTAPAAALAVGLGAFGALVAATAVVATWQVAPYPMWLWLPLQLGGVPFVCCGTLLWWYRPAHRTGPLMTGIGITWYLGDLQLAPHPVLFALGFCLYFLSSTMLVHLVVALPTGRLSHRYERRLVAAAYLAPLLEIPRFAVEYPPTAQGWPDPGAQVSVLAPIGSVIALGLTLATVALVVRRWAAAGRPVRREYTLVWVSIVALGVVFALHPVAAIADASAAELRYFMLAHAVGLFVVPVMLAVGLLRVRLVRLRVADLVLRLQSADTPGAVRAALAHALDDPTLDVVFPEPSTVDGPLPADGRAVTVVEGRGAPLAVVLHDPALSGRQADVDAVVAAARLALENAHLSAAQRTLVTWADAERRRIQRDLHDGVQHKLLAAGMLVDRVRRAPAVPGHQLAAVATQLNEVIGDLRTLAEGIHPPALAERGVAAAVEVLAERAPLPVLVDIPPGRFAEHVERAAYFLVAEALSNVYKHARATHARILARTRGPRLILNVADDGVGGADPARGSGLRGMEDRVRALRGRLTVDSPPGRGTRLFVELPCGS